MILWFAFIVGLFGSLHCIGMCGPIALALPSYSNSNLSVIISRVLYNFGRTLTYGFIGALIGLFGQGLSLVGVQQWLSVISGVLLILIVFLPTQISSSIKLLKPAHHFTDNLKHTFGKFLTATDAKDATIERNYSCV